MPRAAATAAIEDDAGYSIVRTGELRSQTVVREGPIHRDPFKVDAPRDTPERPDSGGIALLSRRTQVRRMPEQVELPAPRRSIDGAVLQVDGDTILCELYSGPHPITVRLPLALFEFSLTRGTPMSLSIIEDENGLKKPVVAKRTVQRAPDDVDREIDRLVDEL